MSKGTLRHWVAAVLAVAGFCACADHARGAVIFDVVTDNGNSNYNVPSATSVIIQLFLRETLTSGSTSTLVAQDGLFSSVVRVSRIVSPSSPSTIIAAARDTTNFSDFNDSAVLNSGADANVGGTRSLGASNGTPVLTDSATVRRVSIGTVTIQAGTLVGQSTTFSLADRTGTSDTLTWNTGQVLDAQILATNFSVTAVPEPAAAGVVAVAVVALAGRRRRLMAGRTSAE